MRAPFLLSPNSLDFPDPKLALKYPNGLLAIGGDLSPERLLNAYQHGIFPWYDKDEPILWWSPHPRALLFLEDLKVSHRLARRIRRHEFTVTFDHDFEQVIRACTLPRKGQHGTWINEAMIEAYCKLHELDHAHSVEVWFQEELVGGIYGIPVGRLFSGESMFSKKTDASKIALIHLVQYLKEKNFIAIDCQIQNPHLQSLGAVEISREKFLRLLQQA